MDEDMFAFVGEVKAQVSEVIARRNERDELGDPGDMDAAMLMIAQSDEDIETLLEQIDKLIDWLGADD